MQRNLEWGGLTDMLTAAVSFALHKLLRLAVTVHLPTAGPEAL